MSSIEQFAVLQCSDLSGLLMAINSQWQIRGEEEGFSRQPGKTNKDMGRRRDFDR
jgi:hypothetical protein